ncbi:hypothetical protein ACROYT_G007801 [Oculina patagonica]
MALIGDLILMWFTFSSAQLWVITDSVERCKQYPNPKNGRVVCDSLFRLFCAPECDDGFMFEFKPAVVYMCGPLTGEWFTYPQGEKIPWPDCVKRKSSETHDMEDDVTTRRAQITQKIQETHQGTFLSNHRAQPAPLVGHPNARYLHLFDYIQRAQQLYNDKQTASPGYNSLEQQRQLKLQQQQQQQQKQKQFQIQQQLQSRQQLMQRQTFIQQGKNVQRQMMEKLRQQREAFESTVTNYQQNVAAPQSTPWRNTAYQNLQGNLQSNILRVVPKPVSPGRAATLSAYYPKMPQRIYNRQQSNPEIKEYVMDLPKRNLVVESSLHESQVENNLMPIKEHMPRVALSQPATDTWQRPDLNRVLPNSGKNVTGLTLQPLQHDPNSVHVSYQLTNQITYPGVTVNPTNQSQYRISQSNQLQAGNLINDAQKREPSKLLTQQAEGQVNQLSVKPASSVFQTHDSGAPSMESKHNLNKTYQIERRGGVGDEPETPAQEKPKKKEKLFYFPIKRDTLIRMLPLNLQAKYRSLRETRNINSSYEAFRNEKKENSTALEDMKVQNLTHKNDPSTNISNFKYSVQQIKTGNDSITEYFDLLPQSTSKIINSTTNSSNDSEMLIKPNNATLISTPETGLETSNAIFSP